MSKTIPLPRPQTLTANLESEGIKGTVTLHRYVDTIPCDVGGPAFEFIYECSLTGARRRWGLIERIDLILEDN